MKAKLALLIIAFLPFNAFSMHIAEGFLPVSWSIVWSILFIPFLIFGFRKLRKKIEKDLQLKLLYAVIGAFVFVLSSLKLPSVAGSSSHMTGIAVGALLFGASGMSVIGFIVLLFQALLLAHGGITTLGANLFSMVVAGAFIAVVIFRICVKFKVGTEISIFLSAFFSDMAIYICTSVQLAIAFQSEYGIWNNFIKFASVFGFTQIPLAIVEGILSVLFFRFVLRYNSEQVIILQPQLERLFNKMPKAK